MHVIHGDRARSNTKQTMVRVLCLEEDDSNKPELNDARSDSSDANEVEAVVARPDPNFHHRFSAALSCYP